MKLIILSVILSLACAAKMLCQPSAQWSARQDIISSTQDLCPTAYQGVADMQYDYVNQRMKVDSHRPSRSSFLGFFDKKIGYHIQYEPKRCQKIDINVPMVQLVFPQELVFQRKFLTFF